MTVFTAGTFDLFHAGHAEFFTRCKELAGHYHVHAFVNTDAFVERFKGRKPVYTQLERLRIIANLGHIQYIELNEMCERLDLTFEAAIGSYDLEKDNIMIVVGTDWLNRDYQNQTNLTDKWLKEHNAVITFVPYTSGISSTIIRNRLGV